MSDIASIVIGLIGLVAVAALLAKREAAGWLRGNSWGGSPLPVVVETRPRRCPSAWWSQLDVFEWTCDYNRRSGHLAVGVGVW